MVMKELIAPWRNWLSSDPSQVTESPDVALLGTDRNGEKRRSFDPFNMENSVRGAASMVGIARKQALREGAPEVKDETLRDFLKPLFCTMEINLATQRPNPGIAPAGVNPMDLTLAGLYLDTAALQGLSGGLVKGPTIEEVKAYASANNFDPDIYLQAVPSDSGTQTMMLMAYVMPMGPQDVSFIEARLFYAAGAVDYPNPIFSKRRCGLWKSIPTTPMSELKTAKAITEAVVKGISSSGTPEANRL
jgi:hypothetical protein